MSTGIPERRVTMKRQIVVIDGDVVSGLDHLDFQALVKIKRESTKLVFKKLEKKVEKNNLTDGDIAAMIDDLITMLESQGELKNDRTDKGIDSVIPFPFGLS